MLDIQHKHHLLRLSCTGKSFNAIYSCNLTLGNMAELVDVTDLKSVDLNNREGSSPSVPSVPSPLFLTKERRIDDDKTPQTSCFLQK